MNEDSDVNMSLKKSFKVQGSYIFLPFSVRSYLSLNSVIT